MDRREAEFKLSICDDSIPLPLQWFVYQPSLDSPLSLCGSEFPGDGEEHVARFRAGGRTSTAGRPTRTDAQLWKKRKICSELRSDL
jgi:hypothetical protein